MYTGIKLEEPIFEVGLKAYLYGKDAVELAKAADRISEKYGVTIFFTPQYVDIPKIAQETNRLLIFVQHLDSVEIGRGNGSVLAEAVKEAGAHGAFLNHVEKRLTLSEIDKTIKRADEVGLVSLVCADSPEQAGAIAHLRPNIILAEPPDLIGTDGAVGKEDGGFISKSIDMVKSIDSRIVVLCSAGIRTSDDVADIIRTGVGGTGSTSGVLKAKDPVGKLEEMIKALKETWRECNTNGNS